MGKRGGKYFTPGSSESHKIMALKFLTRGRKLTIALRPGELGLIGRSPVTRTDTPRATWAVLADEELSIRAQPDDKVTSKTEL